MTAGFEPRSSWQCRGKRGSLPRCVVSDQSYEVATAAWTPDQKVRYSLGTTLRSVQAADTNAVCTTSRLVGLPKS